MNKDIDGLDSLAEFALNLRWSWNHSSDDLWRQLHSELWELPHNPWVVLQTVSRDKIKDCSPILSSAKPLTEFWKRDGRG